MTDKIFSYEVIADFLDNDTDDIKDIAETYVNLAPEMLSDIDKNLKEENWEKLSKSAHKIKSSIRLWKMDETFEAALFIEKNAKNLRDKAILEEKLNILKNDIGISIEQMKSDLNNWDKISEMI